MKIYGLIRDCGDGSSCIDFYRNINTVNKLLEEDSEEYYPNEGSPAVTLNLPDDIDLKEVGITLEDGEVL